MTMKTKPPHFFSARWTVVWCLSSVVCISAVSAWAGDLYVDNVMVSKNAMVYGNLNICNIVATGGVVTVNGGYIIHTFTNSGTFQVSGTSLVCEVLVVGGGGAGGYTVGGGGGGGGVVSNASYLVSNTIAVTVGEGGGWLASGSNSVFGTIVAYGGGRGGYPNGVTCNGASGGSGGGSADDGITNAQPGSGTGGHGYAGGNENETATYGAGGGGGAGSIGSNATSAKAGDGGCGKCSSISGSETYYGGGGGGGGGGFSGQTMKGNGGIGGGGAGSSNTAMAVSGLQNTGGGGGGGGWSGSGGNGGNGGSGIVIVRYLIPTNFVSALSLSSNGINQSSASGTNTFMGKVGIGTNNPAEKLHVVGNLRVDGTNIFSAIQLGNETARTNWPNVLIASSNLFDVPDKAVARTNLGLGSAATCSISAFDTNGAAAGVSANLVAHTNDQNNPHRVTAAMAGALSTNAGALIKTNNLSDVGDVNIARDHLGLKSAATNEAGAFLSATGGVVSGNVQVNGALLLAPAGDVPMGIYTNQ